MPYRFDFRPYRRWFKRSLQTSHGNWDVREGIILRLKDENRTSWGEIAPLSWFGSETLEQALDFCSQLPDEITSETIFSIPASLPACQFGFESALEGVGTSWEQGRDGEMGRWGDGEQGSWGDGEQGKLGESVHTDNLSEQSPSAPSAPLPLCPPAPSALLPPLTYSGLLPTGEAALHQWQTLWNQGYRTFKWKIGVAAIQEELKIFHHLIQTLPAQAQLRLDANGGLSSWEANEWLQVCDRVGIEFLEQPLPVSEESAMLELNAQYSTQLALDESVATLERLQAMYHQGWRGVFVIKPCVAGSPSRLRQFCREHEIDAVFSSVFETTIGRQAALKLASELSHRHRAVGFGINHWFVEDDESWLEHLWK